MTDQRVQFDFENDFLNGGGLKGQGFRLAVPVKVRGFGTFPVRAFAVI